MARNVEGRLSQTARLNNVLHLHCEVLLRMNGADRNPTMYPVPGAALAWQSIHEENVEETKSRSAYLCLCTS